ncbi:MAG: phosphohydrolase [Pseudomonas fluorescens]|nr:phosphohydrolase [Pseudomonas fluorescens]
MKPPLEFPLTDEILTSFALAIGADLQGYRNHIYRVLNFHGALRGADGLSPDAVQIAAAFHDMGIWTDDTLDYLPPSIALATEYLDNQQRPELKDEGALILEHHKLRRYRGAYADSVEPFRQADLVDVSLGLVRFGLPRSFIKTVQATFPDHGFHSMLMKLSARQLIRSPLRPLPMLRW